VTAQRAQPSAPGPRPRESRGPVLPILLVAAVAGACTMTIELAAVRMLAPWYGTSSAVWTNVIAVILLALSLGYLLGANASRAGRSERVLAACLCLGGILTAWLPAAAGPVAGWFLPRGLNLEEASELLVWGSLASALLLFVPATVVLGCVPPLVTQLIEDRRPQGAGSAGGRVLAVSTIGSIIGTFATTYWSLPRLGLSVTFLVAGSALTVLGAAVFSIPPGSRKFPVASGALLLGALLLSRARLPGPRAGQQLLAQGESAYQSVRVVESQAAAGTIRTLQVNESFDSFQSVWIPEPGLLPRGYYYNLFALPAWWGRASGQWRLMVIGLGAGTAWRVCEAALPPGVELDGTGAEIDPLVVDFGRRWMDLPTNRSGRRVLAGWDGRCALASAPGPYDEIVVDAYANQTEIPAHLSTLEFFGEVHDALTPGGWLAVNVGAFGLDDPVLNAIGRTVATAFAGRVLAVRVPFSRNVILFARRSAEPIGPDHSDWSTAPGALGELQQALALPGVSRWLEVGGATLLTDDRNDVELRQRRSLAEARLRAPQEVP
jgi:spermidine synthase